MIYYFYLCQKEVVVPSTDMNVPETHEIAVNSVASIIGCIINQFICSIYAFMLFMLIVNMTSN